MTDRSTRAALSQIDPQSLAESIPAGVLAAALKLAAADDPCPQETNPARYHREHQPAPCCWHAGHEGLCRVEGGDYSWIPSEEASQPSQGSVSRHRSIGQVQCPCCFYWRQPYLRRCPRCELAHVELVRRLGRELALKWANPDCRTCEGKGCTRCVE